MLLVDSTGWFQLSYMEDLIAFQLEARITSLLKCVAASQQREAKAKQPDEESNC